MRPDLVLTDGRVIDAATGTGRVADVAFAGGLCAGIGDGLAAGAAEVRDDAGAIVVPG